MKLNRIILAILVCSTSIVLLFIAGCGSSGGSSNDSTASITLSSDATSLNADGASSIAITAVVTNSAGVSVLKDTGVTFVTNVGLFRNGQQTYNVSTIDDSGVITVSLIAPSNPGIADVRCESSGVTQSLQIHFTHYDNSGLPVAEEFGLSVQYHNISGLWRAGLQDTVYAHLGDFYGNAVQDGVPVNFKTYNTGGFFDPDVAVTAGTINNTTGNDIVVYGAGTAASTLFSTPSPAPAQGMVSVTAETDGGSTTHITSIEVTPGYDNNIIYAGTNGGGVYKSTDRGRNWENISRSSLNPRAGQNWIDPYIKGHSAICVDPDDHNTVYVGTGYLGKGNLFRSLDGGMNWNSNNVEEWNGLFNTTAAVLSVLCDDGDENGKSDFVWIGTEGKGIWFAEDGENFQPSGGIVNVSKSPFGRGDIVSPGLGFSAVTETWTITCVVPDQTINSAPSTILVENLVTPPEKGNVININSRQVEKRETWTLECIYRDMNAGSPLLGDSSTIFSVTGSISGEKPHANVNQAYTSDIIDFVIIPGQAPFIVGDIIQFETVPNFDQHPAYWTVEGSVSGMQAGIAQNDQLYISDNEEVNFTIKEGNIPFREGDKFILQATASTIGHGWTVWDIEKVPGTHRESAVLYAATAAGVYKSNNGGRTWNETGSFTGNYVTSLELYHTGSGSDILYAGTQNGGVWVSTDSGAAWTQYFDGMEMGTSIKDILLDKYNHKLYAVAWYGPRETSTGKFFTHALNSDYTMAQEPWYETNEGLAGSALYAVAAAYAGAAYDPDYTSELFTGGYTSELFTGGEGISFYTTTGNMGAGTLAWQESGNGISNLIMARIPVLFSGECTMDISRSVMYDNIVFLTVYIQDINGNPPIAGSTFKVTYHSNEEGGEDLNLEELTYPDSYTYKGTFSDPGNGYTNNPYRYSVTVGSGDKITLTFNPECNQGDSAGEAGCSGAEQTQTIYF